MFMRLVAAIIITTLALPALAGAPAAHAPPSSASVAQAQAMMRFKAAPVFRDQHGKLINGKTFTAAVENGQRFTSKPDFEHKRFVLTLLPPGVDKPGSFSSADLKTRRSTANTLTVGDKHYRVVFHDPHGNPIDQTTFAAGAARHQRYTTHLDKNHGTAVLTLLPPGVDKPGSQPTSLWATASTMLAPVPRPGTHFPAFDLPRVGGGRIDSASLKGKPYVVDFFFADCIGCIAELPELDAYHEQFPDRRVVAITYDDGRTAADFVKQRHFNWPVLHDGKAFTDKLGIKVYPTMLVVGADGKVLATRIGARSDASAASLEKWVKAALAHASGG